MSATDYNLLPAGPSEVVLAVARVFSGQPAEDAYKLVVKRDVSAGWRGSGCDGDDVPGLGSS